MNRAMTNKTEEMEDSIYKKYKTEEMEDSIYKKYKTKKDHIVDFDKVEIMSISDCIGEIVNIEKAEKIKTKKGETWICVLNEYPKNFIYAGTVLNNILDDINTDAEKEGKTVNDILSSEPFMVEFKRVKNYFDVIIR